MFTKQDLDQLVFNENRLVINDCEKIDPEVLKTYFETSTKISEVVLLNVPNNAFALKLISILPKPLKELIVEGPSLGDEIIEPLSHKIKDSSIEIINCCFPMLTDAGLDKFFNLIKNNSGTAKNFYIHAGEASLENATRFLYKLMSSDLEVGATHGVSTKPLWDYKGFITIKESEYKGQEEFLDTLSMLYSLKKGTGYHNIISIEGLFSQEYDEEKYASKWEYLNEELTPATISKYIQSSLNQLSEQQFQELFGPTQNKEAFISLQQTLLDEQTSSKHKSTSIVSDNSMFSRSLNTGRPDTTVSNQKNENQATDQKPGFN